MNFRSHVYTPLHNAAIWIAAWLYGLESYDDTETALIDLGGAPSLDIFTALRRHASPLLNDNPTGEPIMRLEFPGPGDAPHLPAGSDAALAAQHSGALVFASPVINEQVVITPPLDNPRWFHLTDALPSPHIPAPGEADLELSEAIRRAATLIDARGYRSDALANPRFIVGMVGDTYDLSGLPDATPQRTLKLLTRADHISAIIEAVISYSGDHSLDAELLALTRPIRHARIAAVNYAVAEWGRLKR
ncbi:hypothetical protein [Corynebacterium durum]|uniref:Uncharacterized protein n=1 Tax=Corynebacterium durum F0235 TaxID=1035195 RepID=L1MI64_9CORY|nr:hypothetical protein [Corynebacterium durum]EKX90621.1 hypothetical protein HMPREF9997_01116 [Corynebacterium durum F0235]